MYSIIICKKTHQENILRIYQNSLQGICQLTSQSLRYASPICGCQCANRLVNMINMRCKYAKRVKYVKFMRVGRIMRRKPISNTRSQVQYAQIDRRQRLWVEHDNNRSKMGECEVTRYPRILNGRTSQS